MKQPIYSIIIPHYNIPQLLRRCLNSIPVREDIQVIVVDDCSKGAEKYQAEIPELSRPYVEFYSTPIGGSAGRARNVGIEHAKGKWLTFVDSDDLFVGNAETILDKYKDNPADVLYFQSQSVMCDDLSRPSSRNLFLYHFKRYFAVGDERCLRFEFDAPWGKFIKKSLIDNYNIRFDEVQYSNDTYFSAAIGIYATTIDVPKELLYIVTERAGSLTSAKKKSLEEWTIRYKSALRVQDLFDKNHVSYKRYAFADFVVQLWKSDKKRYFIEMFNLSFKNKCRVLYYQMRNVMK